MPKKIEIYTAPNCGYCLSAKSLLHNKGIEFNEIDVSRNRDAREEMLKKSDGNHTVPQIFIGNRLIGGCEELYKLNSQGKLELMLE